MLRRPVYDEIGMGYANARRPDPRIARAIHAALGDARTVVNVGAGAGSYEPSDRIVTAVEPSVEMRRQRAANAAPCVDATAEALPFADDSFDAGLAVLTVHHWSDPVRGLREMMRVCRRRLVIFTWDPDFAQPFWMTERYLPEAVELDRRMLTLPAFEKVLGCVRVDAVPIPHDCVDGFYGAHWRRPAAYLSAEVRAGISLLRQVDPPVLARALRQLRADLESGIWETEVGRHLPLDTLDLGYRIVTADLRKRGTNAPPDA